MNDFWISASLSLPHDSVTSTFAILAKRGVGKTHTAVVLAEEMLAAGMQTVVLDPIGVWWGLRSSKDGKGPGIPVTVLGGEHGDIPLEPTGGEVAARAVVEEGISVVFDLGLMRKGEQHRFVCDFAETLYRLNRKALHLIVDEADEFAPQRVGPSEARMVGAMEDLVRRGRARGIGVTLITQRSAVLNKNVLTQAETIIALRTISPQDREAVDAWVEAHGDEKRRTKMMAGLAGLAVGQAWVWSPAADIFECVRIRDRRTFDSSATPKAGEAKREPKALAPVDLAKLKTQMAATIERAKANDPRELRRRIAELEVEARAKPKVSAVAAVPPPKRVEVPILKSADARRLTAAAESVAKSVRALDSVASAIVNAVGTVRPGPVARPPVPTLGAGSRVMPSNPATGGRVPSAALSDGVKLRDGERRMLSALKRYGPLRTGQLAFVSCVSPGSFRTYGGTLVRVGLAKRTTDGYRLTEQGEAAVADDGARPAGVRDLIEEWAPKMRAGERKMLGVIAESARGVDSETLSEKSGVAAGSFRTYLGTLRRLGLVESSGDGIHRLIEMPIEGDR